MYEKYAELLEKNNKTNYQVAKATGISQAALCRWKKRGTVPCTMTLYKISKYFNVPMEYFLEEGA